MIDPEPPYEHPPGWHSIVAAIICLGFAGLTIGWLAGVFVHLGPFFR